MRKLLLPSLLILALAGGVAVAQNITKAIQLSQDATGAFGVDSNNNVYFPGHILNTGRNQASPISIAGTGTPTISGTDVSGTITMGSSATTATVTFGRAYGGVPNCVVSWQSVNNTAISYTLATTSISVVQPSTSGNKINYFCSGQS